MGPVSADILDAADERLKRAIATQRMMVDIVHARQKAEAALGLCTDVVGSHQDTEDSGAGSVIPRIAARLPLCSFLARPRSGVG